jgi:hypothetical protein
VNIIRQTKNLFNLLEKSYSVQELTSNSLFSDIEKMNSKYPRISINISINEINTFIKKHYDLKNEKFNDDFTKSIKTDTKLLYALAWKQGDIQKLKYIIQGVLGKTIKKDSTGIVLFYFGKHLSDPGKNPIIDQHVIRSWKLYKRVGKTNIIISSKAITSNDLPFIKDYIKWFKSKIIPKGKDFSYYADRMLFLNGRRIKKTKTD